MGGQPQNGIERRHRIESSVEPEDVFVEIRLQVVLGDGPMMRAENPRLQIGEDQMDHGQVGVHLVGIASNDKRKVFVAKGWQILINAPAVSSYD